MIPAFRLELLKLLVAVRDKYGRFYGRGPGFNNQRLNVLPVRKAKIYSSIKTTYHLFSLSKPIVIAIYGKFKSLFEARLKPSRRHG
ncbi:hypothetical protein BofuT4_uP144380.1 [Botrytis cinerea T4]|uniref:Uncharacterized protein n=1 Tax=Botryotinia fuckeliana (strain T4) TaxID=999810 RepID=G2YYD2_BOTF4|nr:hypothetical protein BofuT4_uP144380.1 [Botrytis cinerea T4]